MDDIITECKEIKKSCYGLVSTEFKMEPNTYSFICSNCKLFLQSFRTFVEVAKSNKDNRSVCGDCVLATLSQEERTKYLVGTEYEDYLQEISIADAQMQKPQFIGIIEKSYNKKLVMLRLVLSNLVGERYVSFNYKYADKFSLDI